MLSILPLPSAVTASRWRCSRWRSRLRPTKWR